MALAAPAFAAPDKPANPNNEVQRGPSPAWVTPSEPLPVPANASGPIFMRYQDVILHIDGKGEQQYTAYRVRLLNSAALPMGNLTMGWNPANGPTMVHTIRVYRDGQVIDVLDKAKFEVLRREDQLEAAMLDGMLTAVLHVPDLRVGDELEVAGTTTSSDPTLGRNVSGLLFLGPTPPPGRYRLELSWEKDRKPSYALAPDIQSVAKSEADRLVLRFDNPPVRQPAKDSPPRYQWQRTLEYSTFADWPAFSRQFAPLFAKAAKLTADSPLRQEAARIAAANADPLARASAALKLVQQDVRYIYVGLNGGNFTAASADETWQRRFGDCKAKTALLMALLGELGVEAEPVLVNTQGVDEGFDARLPNAKLFDHVLVRAHIGGKVYWLDGTLPPVALPSAEPVLPLRRVLPLTAAGSTLAKLEWTPATVPEEITLYEIDARAGFEKPARISTTAIVRGMPGLQLQTQLSSISPGQLADGMRQRLVGAVWQTIEDVQWRYDEKAGASVLKVVGTGTVDWEKTSGGGRSLPLPGGGVSPPDRRARTAEQDQTLPFFQAGDYTCHVTTLRVPSDTRPGQWSTQGRYSASMFGRNYYRVFEFRDGAIRMVRSSRVEQREITAASAQADNARIAAFDNSMGYVFFDPYDKRGMTVRGDSVPTTDEIDWTSPDVPCRAVKPGG
ncbi:MAG: DUF3857 domain-containing protein [Novosphingobium sp.]|uniref:DUF3857 domain-containing protein n=1 Tax=Novosphingobium sp. TaxID=1874826 RepID=UPI00301929D2